MSSHTQAKRRVIFFHEWTTDKMQILTSMAWPSSISNVTTQKQVIHLLKRSQGNTCVSSTSGGPSSNPVAMLSSSSMSADTQCSLVSRVTSFPFKMSASGLRKSSAFEVCFLVRKFEPCGEHRHALKHKQLQIWNKMQRICYRTEWALTSGKGARPRRLLGR